MLSLFTQQASYSKDSPSIQKSSSSPMSWSKSTLRGLNRRKTRHMLACNGLLALAGGTCGLCPLLSKAILRNLRVRFLDTTGSKAGAIVRL